jgi:glycine cleavage system H protein
MNIPADLKYTKNDEWIRVEGNTGTIGITDYAQDQLSDVVYAEIRLSAGDTIAKGAAFGAVESVKAASDVYSPVSGEVMEVNSVLESMPELINTSPYSQAWMVKVKLTNPAELDALMDAAEYQGYLKNREH